MKTVYFIDEDEMERRSCADVLKEIFQGTSISVEGVAPLRRLDDYAELVTSNQASALILDERLNTSGTVAYTGAQLAEHLRGIGANIPIVILTNHPEDDFTSGGWAVENIFCKRDVVSDPASSSALEFKARLSRQIEISNNVMAEREKRYHELLAKSIDGTLSADETSELVQLEADRVAPVAATERTKQQKLDDEIDKLKRLLGDSNLL